MPSSTRVAVPAELALRTAETQYFRGFLLPRMPASLGRSGPLVHAVVAHAVLNALDVVVLVAVIAGVG